MKTFEYRGFDRSGRAARGLVEADDLKRAREKLAALGVLPERVRPVSGAAGAGGRRAGLASSAARADLYRELSSLLRAGLPLSRALELLIESPEQRGTRAELAGIRDRIREGASPSAALGATGVLSGFETAVIEAGQRAGALDGSLDRLAGFLEEQRRIRERVQSALLYPALIGVLATGVAVFMLGFMLPGFVRLWEDARIPLPAVTVAVMTLGRVLLYGVLPALAAGGAGIWLAVRRRNPAVRARAERALFRLPVAGATWTALVSMRFARTLALLLDGGVPLLEALAMAGRATGSVWIGGLAEREADTVRHGGSLADALRRIPPLGPSLAGWVQAGEASGELSRLLESAAVRNQELWDRRLTRAMALLEPLLIVLLGGMVLLVALAILLPILSLSRSLG